MKTRNRAANALRSTAFHEAGHVVASIWLQRPFKYVTIEPAGDALGHMQGWVPGKWFRPDMELTPRVRSLIDAEVSVLFAGGIAEKRHVGRSNRHSTRSDYSALVDLALYVGGDERTTNAYVKWRQFAAEALIDFHWSEVEQLANALLDQKRMTSTEVRAVLFPELKR